MALQVAAAFLFAGASDGGDDWVVIGGTYDPRKGAVVAPLQHFSQYALCYE